MNTKQISDFMAKVDEFSRRGSRDARTKLFASRAHDIVTGAYQLQYEYSADGVPNYSKPTGWTARKNVATETADKLIAMGATEAVYGRGRSLLQK